MNSPSPATSFVILPEYGSDLLPSYTTGYDIPGRPQAHVLTSSPPRYEEYHLTTNISDPGQGYRLTGFGQFSASEHYGDTETGGGGLNPCIPRFQNARPHARHQTTVAVSDPVSQSGSENPDERILMDDVQQLDPEHDIRELFKTLLGKKPPIRRRKRSLILPTSFASEAIDARPRSNNTIHKPSLHLSPFQLLHLNSDLMK